MGSGDYDNIIGEKTFFTGRFILSGGLRIDGRYEGEKIEADSLSIGRNGKVKGDIHASNIIVEGVVIGNIKADVRVMLLPSAKVLGDIATPELIIQNGVVFEGRCKIISGSGSSAASIILEAYKNQ